MYMRACNWFAKLVCHRVNLFSEHSANYRIVPNKSASPASMKRGITDESRVMLVSAAIS